MIDVKNKVWESYEVYGEERPVGFYRINGIPYPSVTSIISNTSDKSGIEAWKLRVGVDVANQIMETSRLRGEYLHNWLEIALVEKISTLAGIQERLGVPFSSLENRNAVLSAQNMFMKLVHFGLLEYVKEIILMEEKSYVLIESGGKKYGYVNKPDIYIKDVNDMNVILDWKGSNKPKRDSYIVDYKIQIAAYYYKIAHVDQLPVDMAKIVVVDEVNKKPTIFEMNKDELNQYLIIFYKRLKYYHEVIIPSIIKNYPKIHTV